MEKADYKNWVPLILVVGSVTGAVLVGVLWWIFGIKTVFALTVVNKILFVILGIAFWGCVIFALWSIIARCAFSYTGKKKLAKKIVEGTAKYVVLPEGGTGLDVGCGSGALTIACAKANPQGKMTGIDRWSWEYPAFNQALCINNAAAEGVKNTEFIPGDAVKLDFPDESFDAVTSNYVYHNISGVNKQQLLEETLRVLKKGGTFVIHDVMAKRNYGDMQNFVQKLKGEGYEKVELIDTTRGLFMSPGEALILGVAGSKLLIGRK